MPITLKFWLHRQCWWLLPFSFGAMVLLVTQFGPGWDLKVLATLMGLFLSLLYFLQKQRLEEVKLFREIFSECNARYDKLNGKLHTILGSPPERPLTQGELKTVVDYFNLCSEEHFYYRQGYILPEVWEAWCNGMATVMKDPRIATVWMEEKESDSYYRLELDKLNAASQTRSRLHRLSVRDHVDDAPCLGVSQ